jgi:hypothetical protein
LFERGLDRDRREHTEIEERLLRIDQGGRIIENPPVPRVELAGAGGAGDAAALVDSLAAAAASWGS